MPKRSPPNPDTLRGYGTLCGSKKPDLARVTAITELLRDHYGEPATALEHSSPFELLIATILSAQCTDAVVNQVTPVLFERFPDPRSLAAASQEEVELIVRPTGFFRNKARNIIAASRVLAEETDGELPRGVEALCALPGVARKTANVVLGSVFGIAEGVVVDTHVMRLTRRWRFHDIKDPVRIERCLMAIIPRERWIAFSHQTIWHGRRICMARSPRCERCPLLSHCPEGLERLG